MSRETLLPAMAAHVLEHGLVGLSLRPLAKAAGTSDRMLIYHFGSKDALVAALLDHLAGLFTLMLDEAFPMGRAESRKACFESVMDSTAQPEFRPFFGFWWHVVAGCARGEGAYLDAAGRIMDRLLQWVEEHLPPDDPDPADGARQVLTLIEGAQMLDAVGRGKIGRSAAEIFD
ncbi:transcriptional regulator, TetR family protein [Erythrobacter litoralis HTCC2594]|uniref:Transcriptional regulator, TetR family protein n=2 Tax=Erythrobacter litoralis TaxID=39960 RepID=Q2N989_ERYLH|nr:transcriptional regulator, TetR family protein [Erythrobacter litoralis HTCC2594]